MCRPLSELSIHARPSDSISELDQTTNEYLRSTLAAVKFLFVAATVAFSLPCHAESTDGPMITGVTQSGVGYVTYTFVDGVINARVGRWDTPFPGDRAPYLEPLGVSTLRIDVDVNSGGLATFDYEVWTYDAGIYDWYDITMYTPIGAIPIAQRLGKPGSAFGTFWMSSTVAKSIDLSPFKGQHIWFEFSVVQDGYGDQTAGIVTGFSVEDPCPIKDLAIITDPDAIHFEAFNGDIADMVRTTPQIRTGAVCLSQLVTSAGGVPVITSGYRPPAYQLHLGEAWKKWQAIKTNDSPECADRKRKIHNEVKKHGIENLGTEPGGPSSSHPLGLAFDMIWGTDKHVSVLPYGDTIDDLAAECGLYRRLKRSDPVHFELQ